jgi:hypothetical protein
MWRQFRNGKFCLFTHFFAAFVEKLRNDLLRKTKKSFFFFNFQSQILAQNRPQPQQKSIPTAFTQFLVAFTHTWQSLMKKSNWKNNVRLVRQKNNKLMGYQLLVKEQMLLRREWLKEREQKQPRKFIHRSSKPLYFPRLWRRPVCWSCSNWTGCE